MKAIVSLVLGTLAMMTIPHSAMAADGDVVILRATCNELPVEKPDDPRYSCDLIVEYDGALYRLTKTFELEVFPGDIMLMAD